MPAALERAGRALALPVAKAPSIAEAGASTVPEALAIANPFASEEAFIFNKDHASATRSLIAEAIADPEKFTDTEEVADTQTCSIGKA